VLVKARRRGISIRLVPRARVLMARRLLFKARLAEQDKTHPGYAAKFRRLSKLMLAAAGGEEVVPHQEPDGFIDALLKNGKLLQPAAIWLRPG